MAIYPADSTIDMIAKAVLDSSKSRIGALGATFKEICPDLQKCKIVDLIKQLRSLSDPISIRNPFADPKEVQSLSNISFKEKQTIGSVGAFVVAFVDKIYRYTRLEQIWHLCLSNYAILGHFKFTFYKQRLLDSDFEVVRL